MMLSSGLKICNYPARYHARHSSGTRIVVEVPEGNSISQILVLMVNVEVQLVVDL